MKNMYQVSIIIPYKNTAGYLKKQLDSIFFKIVPFKLQVIVVNDDSDKNLEEYSKIVNEFSDCVEFYDNDTGVNNAGAARNIGLKYAKGKWLLFADADDCFVEGWEQTVLKYLDSDSDVVYFLPTVINDDGNQHRRNSFYIFQIKLINEYLKNPNEKNEIRLKYLSTVVWSKLIRHSIIKDNNIKFGEVMYCNDNMFMVKYISVVNKIIVSDEIIYCYFCHEGTLTTIHSFQSDYQRALVFCDTYIFYKTMLSTKEFRQLGYDKMIRIKITKELIRTMAGKYSIKEYIKIKKLYHDNHLPFMINPITFLWQITTQIINIK